MIKNGKVLALDYGKKRVGVATGDFELKMAFPRDVFLNDGVDFLVDKVRSICEEEGIRLVVVGLPLNMDLEEEENEMTTEVRFFVKKLREALSEGIDVEFFDERLSSFEAEKFMKEGNNFSGKSALGKDAYAAQIILQRFFDKIVD